MPPNNLISRHRISFLAIPLLVFILSVPARAQFPSTATHCFANCAFPDTGQYKCYNATVEAACTGVGGSFPGQDADYSVSASSLSYTVYNLVGASSVTVDNRTGLMWESTGSCNGAGQKWADALTCCENSTFAGQTDWRLPNVRELMSIVDYSMPAAPFINQTAFPNTQSSFYWSSTTYVLSTASAMYVSFASSLDVSYYTKTFSLYVRCVRAGP